jgi:hypothetical protein
MTPGPRKITADDIVAILAISVIFAVAMTVLLSL